MGAFLESASQGTRLVPESMSHEQRNPIKPLPTARAGVPPRRCPKRAQPPVILRVRAGRQPINPTGLRGHTHLADQGHRASGPALLPNTFLLYQASAQFSHVGIPQAPHLPCRVITECRRQSFKHPS